MTDKVKADFQWWYSKQRPELGTWFALINFYNFPPSMQWGVLVDYFRELNIIIDIHPVLKYDTKSYTEVTEYLVYVRELNKPVEIDDDPIECTTEKEAREKAIEKASEIRDEQLKQ